jgi:hypothetical protein
MSVCEMMNNARKGHVVRFGVLYKNGRAIPSERDRISNFSGCRYGTAQNSFNECSGHGGTR